MQLVRDEEAAAQAAADLLALGLISSDMAAASASNFRVFRHGPEQRNNINRPPGDRQLIVTVADKHYDLEETHAHWFGIRDWRTVVVSVQGQNAARLADTKRLGRPRGPGERSPVPLPDWYELAHLAYDHAAELGLDPTRPSYQYLPGRGEEYVNYSEALHLRQPR